ncbi:MAG: polyprenyl diphosphate synthase [Clostridia bacterium]|nr:polyprenyl diphosphate synthase [Clostridia bacterium]
MKKLSDERLLELGLNPKLMPAHVAIIMDGNGRWAKKHGALRSIGHRAGVNRLREIIRFSSDAGISALTLYAFSTENWKRPDSELAVLFGLLIEYFNGEIDELDENEVCIRAIGELSAFPDEVRSAVENAEARTRRNKGLKLNIALNYGAQLEILRAVRALCKSAIESGELPTQADFENALYTAGLPELDLLIRTSGEMRLSNYLLYQAAYAELYFTEVLWPDFTKSEYIRAIAEFQRRNRRFGGVE